MLLIGNSSDIRVLVLVQLDYKGNNMKKLIFLLLLLLIATPCFGQDVARMSIGVVGGGVPVSGTRPADLLFYINGNGTWSTPTYTIGATEYSAGDTTGTVGSAGAVNTDAKKIGPYGFDFPTSADNFTFTVAAGAGFGDIIDSQKGRIGFWIYFTTIDTTNETVIFRVNGTGGQIAVDTLATGEIKFIYKFGTTTRSPTTTGAGLTNGNWYFIEYFWDAVNATQDYMELLVNGVSKSHYNTTLTPIDFSAGDATLVFGNPSSTTTHDLYIDNLFISNLDTRDMYGGGTGWCAGDTIPLE